MRRPPRTQNRIRIALLDLIRESGGQRRQRSVKLPVQARIVLGLVILIVVGSALLMLPMMGATERLTPGEAIFTAVSALTVTGLSTITAGEDLSLIGQITLLVLIQFGGVGYMFVAAIAMRFIGRKLYFLDRLALSNSIGLEKPEAILQILRRVFIGIFLIEMTGALLLFVHWYYNGIVDGVFRTLFIAIFHAISAFCNAGFDLFGNSTLYPSGMPIDNISLAILGSLILIGGLGIPVISELVGFKAWRKFSLHSRVTIVVVLLLVVIGFLGTWVAEAQVGGQLHGAPLDRQIMQSWFHSISTRTAGFAGFDEFAQIRPATQVLTLVLMFIGSAPASMGGGITTGTFAVLGLAMANYAAGRHHVYVSGREISNQTVRRAGAVLTISVGLVMLSAFLILVTHPGTEVGPVLFEVISAFATCGLSLDFTGELNTFGLIVISFLMAWGRLGALTIVIAVAQANAQPHLVRYPEESLLIG